MINLNRHPASSRRGPNRARAAHVKVVPACLHGLVLPRRGSGVHVTRIAARLLEWWPHARQRALYDALAAGHLRFSRTSSGYDICRLGMQFECYYIVVKRAAGRIWIEGLLSRLPVWEVH